MTTLCDRCSAEVAERDDRFKVKWHSERGIGAKGTTKGYVVCDGGHCITIPFKTYADAEFHRDNIANIYARFGW